MSKEKRITQLEDDIHNLFGRIKHIEDNIVDLRLETLEIMKSKFRKWNRDWEDYDKRKINKKPCSYDKFIKEIENMYKK